ncbi:hypothetical protein CAPTEDRAFT_225532 [Capitella teleta]|uniref:R-spondin Fu-CRD domain-containing protein n=1 Tax=Capitella teleta TaxID=283909 RepID=R7T9D4_CAPTE|nr:hypothetical protein CAPTEDRAFT_225532 [Capitella teleta]|eukprot:ELT88020.1 hypothetical protein CAPTEDRAFT_225532 [Capitella teleta]
MIDGFGGNGSDQCENWLKKDSSRRGNDVFVAVDLVAITFIKAFNATCGVVGKAGVESLSRCVQVCPICPCPPSCEDCDDINGCTRCSSGRFLFVDQFEFQQYGYCLPSCPSGFYARQLNAKFNKCVGCSVALCRHCASDDSCQVCESPFILHEGKCISECPHGLHFASYTKTCEQRVECLVSEWSQWTPCSRQGRRCGFKYGSQARTRDVIQPPSSDVTCPPLSQTTRCRMKRRFCADIENNFSDPWNLPSYLFDGSKTEEKKKKKQFKKRKHKVGYDIRTNSLEHLV